MTLSAVDIENQSTSNPKTWGDWFWHHASQIAKGGAALLGLAIIGGIGYAARSWFGREQKTVTEPNLEAAGVVTRFDSEVQKNSPVIASHPLGKAVHSLEGTKDSNVEIEEILTPGVIRAAAKDEVQAQTLSTELEPKSNVTRLGYSGGGVFQVSDVYAILNKGWIVSVWGSSGEVVGNCVDSIGTLMRNFVVTVTGSQFDIAVLANGGFVVTWSDKGNIYNQIFDNSCYKTGAEILAYTDGPAENMRIIGLKKGGFVNFWVSTLKEYTNKILARSYDSSGLITKKMFVVDDETMHLWPYNFWCVWRSIRIACLADNNFLIIWKGDPDTSYYGKIYNFIGDVIQDTFDITKQGTTGAITTFESGNFATSWVDGDPVKAK